MDDCLRLHTACQAQREIVVRIAVRYVPAIECAHCFPTHQEMRPQIVVGLKEMRRPRGLKVQPSRSPPSLMRSSSE